MHADWLLKDMLVNRYTSEYLALLQSKPMQYSVH